MVIVVIVLAGFLTIKMTGKTTETTEDLETIENSETKVKLETNYGDIVIELYSREAPITTSNFISYVEEGHYDETIFHRVIDGFMIQGGGFTSNGQEKSTHEPIKLESDNGLKNDKYTIAMARTMVEDSATAQFFINSVDTNDFLNYASGNSGYAVFGKVISGEEVVDKIAKVETNSQDKPIEEVKIIKATIL